VSTYLYLFEWNCEGRIVFIIFNYTELFDVDLYNSRNRELLNDITEEQKKWLYVIVEWNYYKF